MKKFLAIVAIAATFTACNDEKKSDTTETKDTTTAVVATAPDTAQIVTTTTTTKDTNMVNGDNKMNDNKMKTDTSKKK